MQVDPLDLAALRIRGIRAEVRAFHEHPSDRIEQLTSAIDDMARIVSLLIDIERNRQRMDHRDRR